MTEATVNETTPVTEAAEGVVPQPDQSVVKTLFTGKILHANLMKVLDPIRARYAELSGPGRAEVEKHLEANAQRCREVARATMLEVKGKMGLKKVWKI